MYASVAYNLPSYVTLNGAFPLFSSVAPAHILIADPLLPPAPVIPATTVKLLVPDSYPTLTALPLTKSNLASLAIIKSV
jgi:hypothetical protein